MKRVCFFFLIYLFCFNIEFKLNCVWQTKENTIRRFLLTIMLNRNNFTEQYQDTWTQRELFYIAGFNAQVTFIRTEMTEST